MNTVEQPDAATRADLLAVEQRRQQALVAVDLDVLADLYDDSIVHIHAPGLTHDKTQLLEHVATRRPYLGTTRGELNIRVVGDVAIMTGPLVNRLRSPDGGERTVGGMVTQVLRRCDDGKWRFLSFQMTPNGEHVWSALPGEQAADATTMNEEITHR
ncbi:MAG: nuclear transport factor 2 family protein [Propionicimonas sp.]|uniref:YybH family protein n=1 Tax=Propionicimonas sp. TaxID=1955623 RepID=UPI003D1000C0